VSAPVPIVGGTGALGYGLAVRLAAAGIAIRIGSRRAESAHEAAERVRQRVPGADVEGAENAECAASGPLVVLTVPFRAQSETLTNLRQALTPDQVLVDCTVPLAAAVAGKATRLLGVPQGSAAQQAQEMAPEGVQVVSAFHTASAKLLADLDEQLDEDILVCGDDREAKHEVARLVERIPGLRPVNAGPLEAARLVEGLTPLIIGINARHKVAAGVRVTGLSESKW
jgi:8-hydroxy-5-deazaflavin:NADPH oxidoreductase